MFDRYYDSERQALLFSRLVKNFTGKRKDLSGFQSKFISLQLSTTVNRRVPLSAGRGSLPLWL